MSGGHIFTAGLNSEKYHELLNGRLIAANLAVIIEIWLRDLIAADEMGTSGLSRPGKNRSATTGLHGPEVSAQRTPSCETFLRAAKLRHDQAYSEDMDEVAKSDSRTGAKAGRR